MLTRNNFWRDIKTRPKRSWRLQCMYFGLWTNRIRKNLHDPGPGRQSGASSRPVSAERKAEESEQTGSQEVKQRNGGEPGSRLTATHWRSANVWELFAVHLQETHRSHAHEWLEFSLPFGVFNNSGSVEQAKLTKDFGEAFSGGPGREWEGKQDVSPSWKIKGRQSY